MSLPYEFEAAAIFKDGRTSRVLVNETKDWLSTTSLPQLPDEMIVLFLLSCENRVVDAQNTIQAYFRIKREAREMFNDRDVDGPELRKAMKTVTLCSIPMRMDTNTVIHFFRLNDTNYRNFDLIPLMKIAYMLVDVSQRSNPPEDLVVVMDARGAGLMHLTRLKINALRKFLEYLQEAMPLKIKMIHLLNSTYVVDKFLALARVFIKNELMAILKTHPPDMDLEQFHKDWVPAACLPMEYGGTLPTVEELNRKTMEQFRELKPFFEAEEKLRSL